MHGHLPRVGSRAAPPRTTSPDPAKAFVSPHSISMRRRAHPGRRALGIGLGEVDPRVERRRVRGRGSSPVPPRPATHGSSESSR
nr:hypothetical protein JVH1_0046 [Rhodococcus sp. JVH1]